MMLTSYSLIRSGTERPYPRQLLQHPFIIRAEHKNVNMARWVGGLVPSLNKPPVA